MAERRIARLPMKGEEAPLRRSSSISSLKNSISGGTPKSFHRLMNKFRPSPHRITTSPDPSSSASIPRSHSDPETPSRQRSTSLASLTLKHQDDSQTSFDDLELERPQLESDIGRALFNTTASTSSQPLSQNTSHGLLKVRSTQFNDLHHSTIPSTTTTRWGGGGRRIVSAGVMGNGHEWNGTNKNGVGENSHDEGWKNSITSIKMTSRPIVNGISDPIVIEDDVYPVGYKSPLSSTTTLHNTRVPLSRMASQDRVMSLSDSNHPIPPSTTSRTQTHLTSSAVTPGLSGRDRLSNAGPTALGLSESSSRRFRSTMRIIKVGGLTARRAGRARPEDAEALESNEAATSSGVTDNEATSPDTSAALQSASSSVAIRNSPHALEAAQLVADEDVIHYGQGPALVPRPFGSMVSQKTSHGHSKMGRRSSDLDPAITGDTEPSPEAGHCETFANRLTRNGQSAEGGMPQQHRLEDLLLAPDDDPDERYLNGLDTAVPRAQKAFVPKRPGRAPVFATENKELEHDSSPISADFQIHRGEASRNKSARLANPLDLGSKDDSFTLGSRRHTAQRSPQVHESSNETRRTIAREAHGTRPYLSTVPASSSPVLPTTGLHGDLKPRSRATSQTSNRNRTGETEVEAPPLRKPLTEISRGAHFNAKSQEAIVAEYQVPLSKESPASAFVHPRQRATSGPEPSSTTKMPHHNGSEAIPNNSTQVAQSATRKTRGSAVVVNGKTYSKVGLLGKGGSSKVWRVLDGRSQILAIKIVSLSKGDHETYHSFCNEIQLLQKLKGHDRVIRLEDSEVDDVNKRLSLVMELGEVDLNTLLGEQIGKPISMNFLRHIWEQMLQAVQVVHDSDIVHTDLKPANFVLVKGNLKLIDFGIAKSIPNDTTNIARESQIGTANYMSPEALMDSGLSTTNGKLMKMGRATDIWALGCILYQMVYGFTPFSKIRPMHLKIMAIQNPQYQIEFQPFSIPIDEQGQSRNELRVEVGQDLIEVMKSCLKFEAKQRITIPELLQHSFLVGTSSTLVPPKVPELSQALTSSIVSRVLQWHVGKVKRPTPEQQDRFVEQLYHSILASQ